MSKYINRLDRKLNLRETVMEFDFKDSLKYKKEILQEYRLSDPAGEYYLSQRCCAEWKEEKNNAT